MLVVFVEIELELMPGRQFFRVSYYQMKKLTVLSRTGQLSQKITYESKFRCEAFF